MTNPSEVWVSVAAARETRARHVRHEAAAGLLAGLLSFLLVFVWNLREGLGQTVLLSGLALALGASISVWVQHVRTQPGELRHGLSPTANGLLRYARCITVLALLLALVYFWS